MLMTNEYVELRNRLYVFLFYKYCLIK